MVGTGMMSRKERLIFGMLAIYYFYTISILKNGSLQVYVMKFFGQDIGLASLVRPLVPFEGIPYFNVSIVTSCDFLFDTLETQLQMLPPRQHCAICTGFLVS